MLQNTPLFQEPVERCCEHSRETSGSTKRGNLLSSEMLYLKMLWAFETMECRIIQLMTDELAGIWQEARVV